MANQPSLKTAYYGKLLHRKGVPNVNNDTTHGVCYHIITVHTAILPVSQTCRATFMARFPNQSLRNSQLVHTFVRHTFVPITPQMSGFQFSSVDGFYNLRKKRIQSRTRGLWFVKLRVFPVRKGSPFRMLKPLNVQRILEEPWESMIRCVSKTDSLGISGLCCEKR